MMSAQLYIAGTKQYERPGSRCTIFADGSAGAGMREGIDLELSHWFPNRTPKELKADTSTEICMNFVASPPLRYDLVINNHADVDGVLSVFTLLYPEVALAQRSTIVSAAAMGDFWSWAESPGQILFQGLTKELQAHEASDPQVAYIHCLDYVHRLIGRDFVDPDVYGSLAPLRQSVDWIAQGKIAREEHHPRFVHYAVPKELFQDSPDAALRVPGFNAMISDECLFWPQARARWDRERVQLVSVKTVEGWYYDLWYPSYSWADTPNSWQAPGLKFSGESNEHTLSYPPLEEAARAFQGRDGSGVQWNIERDFSLFSTLGRGYPVVLSAMNGRHAGRSSLDPDFVARRLAAAFSESIAL